MNNEENTKNFSFISSLPDEIREAWEEIYGLEDFENGSDYEDIDYAQNSTSWTVPIVRLSGKEIRFASLRTYFFC